MRFTETRLAGVWIIDPQRHEDERGFFARTFADNEFRARGLATGFTQCSVSYNERRGTLRGMHLQVAPHLEMKLIRCTSGAVYDVTLDVRRDSATYGQWMAVELSADNRRLVYIPAGLAHGFQTLTAGAEVFYEIAGVYAPGSARGFRWDDPAFGIEWPDAADRIMCERDRTFPLVAV